MMLYIPPSSAFSGVSVPHMRWDQFLVAKMTLDGVLVAGKKFLPLSDQLMKMQLIWELGPRRAVRVAADGISDEIRAANPDDAGHLIDRPSDLGATNAGIVEEDMVRGLSYVGIPQRPARFIWCAQYPTNSTWPQFFRSVFTQQANTPDPRDDTLIMRILLEDLEFED
ncbi:hypothetical protein D1871_08915 [Nakamurella silvestris]|nr:hypothetical protein D1871_08915 [Nakamurella silvestris]